MEQSLDLFLRRSGTYFDLVFLLLVMAGFNADLVFVQLPPSVYVACYT